MNMPFFQRGELLRISRIIGSLLTFIGGMVLVIQTMAVDLLPPPPGYGEVQAVVANKYQRGTFMEPAFSIMLSYEVSAEDGSKRQIRSGLRVAYEDYYRVNEGDAIIIYYDMGNPYSWQLVQQQAGPRDYALGILMALIGLFSLGFPFIVGLASRQEDFEFSEAPAELGEIQLTSNDG